MSRHSIHLSGETKYPPERAWAVAQSGKIDVRTVSRDREETICVWLIMYANPPLGTLTDDSTEVLWQRHSKLCDAALIEVIVVHPPTL